MELVLVKMVALLRPLASTQYAEALAGVFSLGLIGALVVALLVRSALQKSLRLSAVDAMIVAFTGWCLATSIIYYEWVRIEEVGKVLIPLLSYTLVKNTVPNHKEYRRLILWMIMGFSVPTLASAVLIALGSPTALDRVNYWTNENRWQGVYSGPHTLGHSMALLLIALVVYIGQRSASVPKSGGVPRTMENNLVALLGVVAMYCLYMSSVRSALLGLLTFLAIYTYATNRKQFVIGGGVLVLVAAVTSPYWLERFNPELGAEERGVKVEVLDYGSGRPRLWLNDLRVFADRPIDEMLAGAGIGNRSGDSAGGTVYGHNDWLEMLTQTGLIGFLLFATLQAVILRKILRMHGNDRYRFLGFFAAVNIMMLVSNSYAWRIQVSQLYYMMLAFIEIPTNRSEAEGAHIRGQSMEHGESV